MFLGQKLFGMWQFIELVRPLRPRNAFIDGLAADESFVRTVPVSDGVFAHPPAEQHDACLLYTSRCV